jgi:hypothetical protein
VRNPRTVDETESAYRKVASSETDDINGVTTHIVSTPNQQWNIGKPDYNIFLIDSFDENRPACI